MKQLFLPYPLALIAKENEFNEPCLGYFDYDDKEFRLYNPALYDFSQKHVLLTPTYQQIVDWFREKHKLDVNPKLHWTSSSRGEYKYFSSILDLRIKHVGEPNSSDQLITDATKYHYYEALNKAIEEAFKLI